MTAAGIPNSNILEWETTNQGMREATVQTQKAITGFYAARSAGATSSTSFYANATQAPTNKPTPSPIPKAKKAVAGLGSHPVRLFNSREDARTYVRQQGKSVMDATKMPKSLINFSERWFVFE